MFFYKKMMVISSILILTSLNLNQQAFAASKCQVRPSACALGFKLKVRRGTDICWKSVLGVTVKAWTGPAGKNVTPHPSVHGWKLYRDYKGGRRDYWKKNC